MIAAILRYTVILGYLAVASLPLVWMGLTSIKPKSFTEATSIHVVPAVGSQQYAGVSLVPPEDVVANAAAAIAEYESKDDVWDQGFVSEEDLAFARSLAAGEEQAVEDLRTAHAWLVTRGEGFRQKRDFRRRNGPWQDWMGRGGEAGLAWMERTLEAMDAADARWAASIAFPPSLEGYAALAEPVVSTSERSYFDYLWNSIVIGFFSTLAAVLLGTSTAYGFSRFKVAGAQDWLFFILSTRFLPPLAVVVPILLMYRHFDLPDTHLGLIILYTAFNLSLAVWLMKGFIDEIPKAFEEAAWIDGYSRAGAFVRIVLPQARTGMAVTAVFCLISAWNEYGFAKILNGVDATTVPVFFAGLQGRTDGIPWHTVAAGSLLFVVPIVVFVVLVRRHLLRGVTFGTVKG